MDFELTSLEGVLEEFLPKGELAEVQRVLYGRPAKILELSKEARESARVNDFELRGWSMPASPEETSSPRNVTIALVQNKVVLPTDAPVLEQVEANHRRVGELIETAGQAGANIVCLQEAWTMPYGLCTRERLPWTQFAENPETGASVTFLARLAAKHQMVIVSPILERDEDHGDILWNTAVVIDHTGRVMGKSRKNHIPRHGDCPESNYYSEGNTGHRVFSTIFGKLAVNICYGRRHPQNWMMYGLNGAEIVFSPCATTGGINESTWAIETRNAAVANSFFACAVNRVGVETFPREFSCGDGLAAHRDLGYFYGSSYVASPDGSRTPGLGRLRDGVLLTQVDLNLCRQAREKWGLRMTQRLKLYADSFAKASRLDFKPEMIV